MHRFGIRKVVIIGCGRVGSHAALALLCNQLVDEIVLVDVNEAAAVSEMMDLKDFSTALGIHVAIRVGDYSDCADARFLIMTAGRHRKPGESRRDMLEGTFDILSKIVGPIKESGFDGTLISVSNPADIVAEYLYRSLDLPRSRNFGTGTALDTIRLQRVVGTLVGMERSQVQAIVMGEHGDSSFVPESHVSLGGIPLDEYLRLRPEHADKLQFTAIGKTVHESGASIIQGKGATEFGIGATVAMIVSSILHNEKRVIPLSAHLRGEYDERFVSVGVPCLVGQNGIEQVYELELSDEESKLFHKSCEIIRSGFETIVKKV